MKKTIDRTGGIPADLVASRTTTHHVEPRPAGPVVEDAARQAEAGPRPGDHVRSPADEARHGQASEHPASVWDGWTIPLGGEKK